MATAASIWSMAGPVVPMGKNRVGSESRQAARSRQSVVMVVSKAVPNFVIFFTSILISKMTRTVGFSKTNDNGRIPCCKWFS